MERQTRCTCLNHDDYVVSPLDMTLKDNNEPNLGTWCGANRNGRIAVILNLRTGNTNQTKTKRIVSRGNVTMRYLTDKQPASDWNSYAKFASKCPDIKSCEFNMFYGDCKSGDYTAIDSSGHSFEVLRSQNPYLVISNDSIESATKWPKIELAEKLMRDLVRDSVNDSEDDLLARCFSLASHKQDYNVDHMDKEKVTSSNIFVPPLEVPKSEDLGASVPCGRFYGTRSQIVVLVSKEDKSIRFVEHVLYDSDPETTHFCAANPKKCVSYKINPDLQTVTS